MADERNQFYLPAFYSGKNTCQLLQSSIKYSPVSNYPAKDVKRFCLSSAERASKMAAYYRRAEEYVFQANLAASELVQYGKQIIASLIREQIIKKEYDNHLVQIEQAQSIGTFLKD